MIKINYNGCNSRMIIVVNLNSFRFIFQNNDKEKLKEIYTKYIEAGSENEVNVSFKNRETAREVFERLGLYFAADLADL